VADILDVVIQCAKFECQIEGVVPYLLDGGLSILQQVDDMIIFMKNDFKKSKNLELTLSVFEQLLDLKINSINVIFFMIWGCP
jgi:hypothetical protein